MDSSCVQLLELASRESSRNVLLTCMLPLSDPHFQEVRLHQVQRLRLRRHDGREASDSRWLWREVHPQQGAPVTLEVPARQLDQVLAQQPSNKVV